MTNSLRFILFIAMMCVSNACLGAIIKREQAQTSSSGIRISLHDLGNRYYIRNGQTNESELCYYNAYVASCDIRGGIKMPQFFKQQYVPACALLEIANSSTNATVIHSFTSDRWSMEICGHRSKRIVPIVYLPRVVYPSINDEDPNIVLTPGEVKYILIGMSELPMVSKISHLLVKYESSDGYVRSNQLNLPFDMPKLFDDEDKMMNNHEDIVEANSSNVNMNIVTLHGYKFGQFDPVPFYVVDSGAYLGVDKSIDRSRRYCAAGYVLLLENTSRKRIRIRDFSDVAWRLGMISEKGDCRYNPMVKASRSLDHIVGPGKKIALLLAVDGVNQDIAKVKVSYCFENMRIEATKQCTVAREGQEIQGSGTSGKTRLD